MHGLWDINLQLHVQYAKKMPKLRHLKGCIFFIKLDFNALGNISVQLGVLLAFGITMNQVYLYLKLHCFEIFGGKIDQ